MLKRTVEQQPGGSTAHGVRPDELASAGRRIGVHDPTTTLLQDGHDLSDRTLGMLKTQRDALPVHAAGEDERTLEPGATRVGRFIVVRPLGEGSMSRVYLAHDPELDRNVAVKVFRASGADDLLRRQREAHALARISHPNVVQIYESGNLDSRMFIVMEYVTGVTLTAWQTEQPRTLMELLAMYVAVGRGLVAAHAVGVVHRDFKPDNVIVDTAGRPRVADFGLASIRGRVDHPAADDVHGSSVTSTSVGVILGTPAYMPPEQYSSSQVGESADQFSFCAALFEALYGERPYPGETIEELRVEVSAGQLREPPPERRAPPAIHLALLRGLARDPAARWPSLVALLDHLDHYDPGRDPSRAASSGRSPCCSTCSCWWSAA
ncbi:MAG: serine/threonine protein kinase [Myxococcales bacterium]|nr:serine/threonine protein kinase [Myxococcales bacterium]